MEDGNYDKELFCVVSNSSGPIGNERSNQENCVAVQNLVA